MGESFIISLSLHHHHVKETDTAPSLVAVTAVHGELQPVVDAREMVNRLRLGTEGTEPTRNVFQIA